MCVPFYWYTIAIAIVYLIHFFSFISLRLVDAVDDMMRQHT